MSGGPKHHALPTPPESLDDEAAERLTALVEGAVKHQRQATAEAIERTFDHVPRLLRVPVRKILGV
jgi:hypothetical protein